MKADYDELSELGVEQARALGRFLQEHAWSFDAVFTGPARRHRDTTTLAATMQVQPRWPEAIELPQLDEHDAFGLVRAASAELVHEPEVARNTEAIRVARSFGERSRSFQQLFEFVMGRWLRGEFEPAGIESWPEFRARVHEGLDTLLAAKLHRAIAFSSVGPLAVILQRSLGTTDLDSFRTAWRIRNTSLTSFVFDATGRITLDGFNALPHLPKPETWTFR